MGREGEGRGGGNLLLPAAWSVLVSLFCADVYLSCPALLCGALWPLLVDRLAYLSAITWSSRRPNCRRQFALFVYLLFLYGITCRAASPEDRSAELAGAAGVRTALGQPSAAPPTRTPPDEAVGAERERASGAARIRLGLVEWEEQGGREEEGRGGMNWRRGGGGNEKHDRKHEMKTKMMPPKKMHKKVVSGCEKIEMEKEEGGEGAGPPTPRPPSRTRTSPPEGRPRLPRPHAGISAPAHTHTRTGVHMYTHLGSC